MDLSTLYWILILPNLGKASLIIMACLVIIVCSVSFVSYLESNTKGLNFSKGLIKYIIFFMLIGIFIPSNKQMMYLMGGYAVTNIEGIEKLPKNVMGAANKFLKDFNIEDKK